MQCVGTLSRRTAFFLYGVSKADIGARSNFEASKGRISDILKRCATLFGAASYLYWLPAVWVMLDKKGRLPEATLAKLRNRLRQRMTPAA